MKIKRIILLILTIIWIITVFSFSNEEASKSKITSGRIAAKIVELTNKGISKQEKIKKVKELQHIVRKTAHVTLYTIGGVLLFLFCNTYDIGLKKKIIYAIIVGGSYAAFDEIHQSFVPGRGPQFSDVILDTTSVAFGIIVVLMVLNLIKSIPKIWRKKA